MANNFGYIDFSQANMDIPVVTYGIPKGATEEKPEGVNINLNDFKLRRTLTRSFPTS